MTEKNQHRIFPEGWNLPYSNPAYTVKIISLAIATTVLLTLDWWLINLALNTNQALDFWIWPVAVTMLWIIALSFFSLTNRNRPLYALVNLIPFLAYLFIMPNDLLVIAGGALFIPLAMWFQARIRTEEKNYLHFSIVRILNSGIGIMIYALLIVLGFNIYFTTNQDFKNNPDAYYDRLGASALKSIRLGSGLAEDDGQFDLNQTLDDYLARQINSQDLKQFDLSQAREEILRNLNVSAVGSETLAEVLSKVVVDQMKELVSKYDKFFPLIFTLIVIALLRMFAFLFKWTSLLVMWLLYKVLLGFGFLKLTKVVVEVEQLEI
ncbi:MAG: hypothetical protein HYW51_01080 [Candidatus Doudnabacteria bacterium]|nr:hypothetical protein [Candidatus Doudnabacteria bacterium]